VIEKPAQVCKIHLVMYIHMLASAWSSCSLPENSDVSAEAESYTYDIILPDGLAATYTRTDV